jgi:hypothetical protein
VLEVLVLLGCLRSGTPSAGVGILFFPQYVAIELPCSQALLVFVKEGGG